jgi:hypothetical protein
VAGRVGHHEGTPPGGEEPMRHVDGGVGL